MTYLSRRLDDAETGISPVVRLRQYTAPDDGRLAKAKGLDMTIGEYNAIMWNIQRANDAYRAAEKHNAQGHVDRAAEAWRNYRRYVANADGIEERCS